MLQCRNIAAGYADQPVVHSVNLTVEPGRIIGLIGSNGAGKTTILRTCIGLLSRMDGEIVVDGQSQSHPSPADMLGKGVALVPEGRGIFGGLNVRENLLIGGFTIRNKPEMDRRLDGVYAMFPRLKERQHISGALLSGGEQQMLAIGRALMSEPRYLLLDEPSMGLSPLLVEFVGDLIVSLAKKGIGILAAEQNANFVLDIADHGCLIENGTIILSDTAENLRADSAIRRAYLGWDEE